MSFGSAFRRLRVEKGYGLRDVAAAVGRSATYLSHVERGLNGHVAPPPDVAEALISAISATDSERQELTGLLHQDRCPTCGSRLKRHGENE